MESEIDPTVPVDNQLVDKSQLRANFEAAKNEIEQLMVETSLAWQTTIGIVRV